MPKEEFRKRNLGKDDIIDKNYIEYVSIMEYITDLLNFRTKYGEMPVGSDTLLVFSPKIRNNLYNAFRLHGYRTYEELLKYWPSDEFVKELNIWHPDVCVATTIKNLLIGGAKGLQMSEKERITLRSKVQHNKKISLTELRFSETVDSKLRAAINYFYTKEYRIPFNELPKEWYLDDLKKCFHERKVQMCDNVEEIKIKLGAEDIVDTTIRTLDKRLSSIDDDLFPDLFY